MAAPPWMTTLLLLFSALAQPVCSGIFKRQDTATWPEPPCEMYYPWGPRRDSICPDITAYVCASEGHTYKNECFFCIDRWEFGYHIQFIKYGKCD
uniref:Serine peptidase inhibitor Kazal type 13 n=1 Tax=Catagonus wagneri TaxID=51154 RepID=A0A8C3VRM4_9CETA